MNKLLLSTAFIGALSTTAAFAAGNTTIDGHQASHKQEAGVSIGGYGRFGVLHTKNATTGIEDTNLTSRLRLQIDATAQADTGMTFGATVRLQQDNTRYGSGNLNGARFFARVGNTEIGVGNIYGALEFMPGMYPFDLGLTGLGYQYTAYQFRGDAYSSTSAGAAGSNGVEAIYARDNWSVHVSASEINDRVAAHATYDYKGWTFAVAAQDSDSPYDTEWAASATGKAGPADVTFAWADNGIAGDHWTVAASAYAGEATQIDVYFSGADAYQELSHGIGVNHDLGGGASLRGGVASFGNENVRADLGVKFNF